MLQIASGYSILLHAILLTSMLRSSINIIHQERSGIQDMIFPMISPLAPFTLTIINMRGREIELTSQLSSKKGFLPPPHQKFRITF